MSQFNCVFCVVNSCFFFIFFVFITFIYESRIINHYMVYFSRWIATQQKLPQPTAGESSKGEEGLDCYASYRDPEKQVFGCEHYKRNCKIRAACCGKLFTCRFCHDKASDHSMDR